MIYSVQFYYHKRSSRKAASKFEGIVFAKNQDHAKELVKIYLPTFCLLFE